MDFGLPRHTKYIQIAIVIMSTGGDVVQVI